MRRRIASRAYCADPPDEGGVLGIEQIDRRVGPIGQDVELDLRVDEADVECAEADAADIDRLLQDKLFVPPHPAVIIAPARIVGPGSPASAGHYPQRDSKRQKASTCAHVQSPPIVFVHLYFGADRIDGR